MASPTAIEASLRLDIAQMKAALAESRGEAKRWKEKLREEGRGAAQAVDPVVKAHAAASASMASMRTINPWTTASAGALEYQRVLERMTPAMAKAHAMLGAAGGRSQSFFAPKQSNPWATASAGYTKPERLPQMAFSSEFDSNRMHAQQALQQRTAAQSAGRGGSGGGGGLRGIGQASMQAQDIAVQLQMGTRASIVLAQQGSQLLGAFGAGGAIVGGVIAIAGAFVTMGENAREAFKAAREEEAKFDAQLKVTMTGSVADLINGLGLVDDRVKGFTDELSNLNSRLSLGANIADIFGGPSVEERINQAGELLNKAGEQRVKLANRLMEMSGQEAQIAVLRAAGEKDKADEMERQVKLANELARINALPLPQNIREQLGNDARTKSAADAATPRDAVKDKEEIIRLEEQLHEQALKNLDPVERYLALSREQEAVFASMAEKGGLFFEQSAAGLEAWAAAKRKMGDTAGLIQVLKMQDKTGALQQQMDQASNEAKQGSTKQATEADTQTAERKRLELTRATLEIETKIAREQARTGKDDGKTLAAFRDELNVLQLTAQVQEQLKVTQSEALKIAREKVANERAAVEAIKAQAAAEKAKDQLYNRQELAAKMRSETLRAAGKDKAADAQDRQIRVAQEARNIQQTTGLDPQQSTKLARQRIATQERGEDRAARDAGLPGRDGGKIRSLRDGSTLARVSDYDAARAAGGGGGAAAVAGLQARPSAFDKLQAEPSAFDRLQAQPSAYAARMQMGLPQGGQAAPLDAQHAQNAAAAGAAGGADAGGGSHDARMEQLLREMNETLKSLAPS